MDAGGEGYAAIIFAFAVFGGGLENDDASIMFRVLLCASSSACTRLLSSLATLALFISSSLLIRLLISWAIRSGVSSPNKEAVSLFTGEVSSYWPKPRGLLGGAGAPPNVGVAISVLTLISSDGFLLVRPLLLLLLLLLVVRLVVDKLLL